MWLPRRGSLLLAAIFSLTASLGVLAAEKATAAKKASSPTEEEAAPTAAIDMVRISIQTSPPRKAQVKWGRKVLGIIPVPRALVVERPRDSGPMDLVIRAPGYLPVHTRAYTFNDSRVSVKLTPPSEKSRLFGYKQEIAPSPDAGVPLAPPVAEPPKE